ncbi:uncharacterized protein IL334_001434 [Kwoniella shivajii]|uniref:Uncharacterized protein n=1 Tax=Kwoniella shivajii TaxID=564305 RepID=A0ABZ1CT24_9TREE|nr:hypothetical protein IL334_001434 [Kwoniella shivajii]
MLGQTHDLLTFEAFQQLLPVHDLILSHLSHIAPVTYILLSKKHYDRHIPLLYHTIAPDSATLYGLTQHAPLHERTLAALRHTNTLVIGEQHVALYEATLSHGPFPRFYEGLFPNVKRVELGWKTQIHSGAHLDPSLPCRQPIENILWRHVRIPLESVTLNEERLDPTARLNIMVTARFIHGMQAKSIIFKYDYNASKANISLPVQIWRINAPSVQEIRVVLFPVIHSSKGQNHDSPRPEDTDKADLKDLVQQETKSLELIDHLKSETYKTWETWNAAGWGQEGQGNSPKFTIELRDETRGNEREVFKLIDGGEGYDLVTEE